MATAVARAFRAFSQHALNPARRSGTWPSPFRAISTCPSLADDDNAPSDAKAASGRSEIVDPEKDSSLQEVLALPVPKPLMPGSVPMYIRIENQPLIKALQNMEMLGTVTLAAFARQGQTSQNSPPMSGSDEDPPTSDSSVPADQLEEIGTLAQMKGMTWSTTDSGDNVAQIGVQGLRRVRRMAVLEREPLKLQVRPLPNEPYNPEADDVRAKHQELVTTMKQLFEQNPLYMEQLRHIKQGDFGDKARFADLAVGLMNATVEDNQAFLNELNVPARLMKAIAICKKELELLGLQKEISRQVEEKFTKEQKRYFLTEQMKHIQKELGITKDEKGAVIQKFLDRFDPIKHAAPEEVRQAVEEEMNKMRVLDPASSEYNVTRNYLDWLTSMPWGKFNEETFDIAFGRACLDADHYGLQDVKDRILEFIAVGKLNDQVQGKIVCMVGPPGVGKTSIGKSIAKSLGRKFYRFSVGGLSDVAEIKGHRRTYVGAMPGKLVQCLKQVQSSNPMVLIDEVDKLGRGYQGDPASALLELLDPEQNFAFRDHYLDVPLDLSKVLFVCTANVLDTIPRPLLDRMEVIQLSGYTEDEKRHIARLYLEKEVRAGCAIPENSVELTDGALDVVIKQYCRESGVRNLKKQLEKAYRKVALKLATSEHLRFTEEPVEEEADGEGAGSEPDQSGAAVEVPVPPRGGSQKKPTTDTEPELASSGPLIAAHRPDAPTLRSEDEPQGTDGALHAQTPSAEPGSESGAPPPAAPKKMRKVPHYDGEPIVIDENNLDDYLGKAPFDLDRFYRRTPVGVVMGLAWTAMGGSTLYVESNRVSALNPNAEPSLTLTGQLGDVFKESLKIAQTYARQLIRAVDPENTVLEHGTVHLHVPQGGVPKDGPSAGCTTVTALLSLAFNTAVIPDVAMTGEISLSGRVLPIGGVKEKTLAAKRSQVTTIIFPAGNRRDWEELDDELRAGLEPVFAEHYVDLLPLLFPSVCEDSPHALKGLQEASQGLR